MESLILDPILEYAKTMKASDVHIVEWKTIVFRVSWKLILKNELWTFDTDKTRQILLELYKNKVDLVKEFLLNKDDDFAYLHHDWSVYRVNAFFWLGKMEFILRSISTESKTLEELWLPKAVEIFTELKQWLVLITWPTWSWKSTTMVALLDRINRTRSEHIITIEDPIEFIFKDNKSIFSQREVWKDTKWFDVALRAAMREDPNIIVIWEMRDEETVKTALELSETWHLVISTLHTSGSVQTISRILSFFPAEVQWTIINKLSDNLKWVLSQRLIPKANWTWLIWIFELMFVTLWIKNLIRTWNINQISSTIETWSRSWMILMETFANNLRDKWIVKESDYQRYFIEDWSKN